MVKETGLITEDEAVECGMVLNVALESLDHSREIAKLHGDTVASLYRVAAMRKYKTALQTEKLKALILSAAGDGYEVAESDRFKIPDEVKLQAAVTAMARGYLISDAAGPHFTVIMGKGGMSLLIKETGHRHKLKRSGAKRIDVKAVAVQMREKLNAKGKYEMLIEGSASCEIGGEVFSVERVGQFPIILPCYETDGPDGLEAKARRRLIRDLWQKVSGEFDAIELDEVDDEAQVAAGTVEVLPKIERTETMPATTTTPKDDEGVPTEAYWNHQWKTAATTVGHTEGDPHVLITFARTIRDAKTVEEMDVVIADAKQCVGKEKYQFSQKFMIRLTEYRDWRARQMTT